MKTYTEDQLKSMTDLLNTSMDAVLNWHLEIQSHYKHHRHMAYIYNRSVGSLEFIETDIVSGEFKFLNYDPVCEGASRKDIFKVARSLDLV